jgi:hypothetical protein
MRHDVDMQNPVCWLEKSVSGYCLPDAELQVNPIRLVIQPFQLHFRSQASCPRADLDMGGSGSKAPVQYLQMKVRCCWHNQWSQ